MTLGYHGTHSGPVLEYLILWRNRHDFRLCLFACLRCQHFFFIDFMITICSGAPFLPILKNKTPRQLLLTVRSLDPTQTSTSSQGVKQRQRSPKTQSFFENKSNVPAPNSSLGTKFRLPHSLLHSKTPSNQCPRQKYIMDEDCFPAVPGRHDNHTTQQPACVSTPPQFGNQCRPSQDFIAPVQCWCNPTPTSSLMIKTKLTYHAIPFNTSRN
jgi:hypothetical protein